MNQKKERRIFSKEFRLSAVERMIAGESPSALARELGVLRKSLYEWKDTYAKLGEVGLARQIGNGKWEIEMGTVFHEAAASVNRKCSFWYGFFFSFASIYVPLHETRRRSRPRGVCAP